METEKPKKEDFFMGTGMEEWNQRRVDTLVRDLGVEWFPGKRVLDVGCGHGNNGRLIQKLGAEVAFTDGRPFFVDFLKEDGFEAHLVDHDKEWTVPGHFDLIIHWGLLYHLDNWRLDLKCCFQVAPIVCLETEIIDYADPAYEQKKEEMDQYDHAVNRIGSVMTANCLQGYVESLDSTIRWNRYDVNELNCPGGQPARGPLGVDLIGSPTHYYDWLESDSGFFRQGQRRYWVIKKG